MGDWAAPLLSTGYATFLTNLKDRDLNAATLFSDALPPATNIPTGAIRYNRATAAFQEWNGTTWINKTIGTASGGTGGTDPATARAALGIGSMGTQSASAVAITGGTIAGITSLSLSGHILFSANNSFDIGSGAFRVRNLYIGSGLVLPVGVDKWVVS